MFEAVIISVLPSSLRAPVVSAEVMTLSSSEPNVIFLTFLSDPVITVSSFTATLNITSTCVALSEFTSATNRSSAAKSNVTAIVFSTFASPLVSVIT